MDPQLIESSIAFAQIEDDQSNRQRHHEGRFIQALEATPPTGTGFHPHAQTLGNYAVMAGLDEPTFIDAVRPYISGSRTVPDSELSDAWQKAARNLVPATSLGSNYTPKPRIAAPKPFEPVIDLDSLEPATEADLKASSPVPIPEHPDAQGAVSLSVLFQPDEQVFTGKMETKARPGRDIKTPKKWFAGPVPQGPFFCCNPLTGEQALTGTGKLSFRCDNAVADHQHLVVEFDATNPGIQLAICQWFTKSGCVVSITFSGSKSFHIVLKVSATDAADYKRIKAKLKPYLLAIGADRACFNASRLTRLPGAKRPDKGGIVQRLIYLNDNAQADVEGLIDAFKELCINEEKEPEMEAENKTLLDLIPAIDVRKAIENDPPPRQWIFGGLIPVGAVGMVSGGGGAGKSHLAFLMAAMVSIDSPHHQKPFQTSEPGKVLYLNNEDSADEIWHRLHDLCEVYRFGAADIDLLEKNLTILPAQGLCGPLMEIRNGNPVPSKFYLMLRNLIIATSPKVVILDTKSRLFGLDENSQSDNAEWLRHLEALCRLTGCTVIILHHLSKQGRINGGVNAVRGASTLTDNCRFVLSLAPIDEKIAQTFEVDPQKFASLKNDKHNYGPSSKVLYFEREKGGVLVYRDLAGERQGAEYGALMAAFKNSFEELQPEECPTLAQLSKLQRADGDKRIAAFQTDAKEFFAEDTFTQRVKDGIRRFCEKAIMFNEVVETEIRLSQNGRKKAVLCC